MEAEANVTTNSSHQGLAGPQTNQDSRPVFDFDEPAPGSGCELSYERHMGFTPLPYHTCSARVGIKMNVGVKDVEPAYAKIVDWTERNLQGAVERARRNHHKWIQALGITK